MTAPRRQGGRLRRPHATSVDGLTSKLARPRVPPNYVARTRLNGLLDEGTRRPLTVVSAGAGWGKTLATAAWAESAPDVGPVAWVSLDASDNEPRVFWTCFVTAMRAAVEVPADNPLAQLAPGLGNAEGGLQRLMAGLEQLTAPVVVVLDDFHLIDEPSVLSGVASLLRHPLEQLRLVILTRADPPLPLHRLRMTEELSEVRSRDLAFDESDAASMLAAHDVAVSPAEVRLLVRRTEGWPAGMRLAALFLRRGDPARRAASFAGDDQAVTDYLVGEVLASQPPEIQRFLLRTSVVERLTSGLAEALTGDSHGQHHLEVLESSNAFVVGLGPGREWFRYHALLREMLRHRLGVEEPDELQDLHRRAAHWFASHGRPIEAMRHAADAEDWHLLGRLFVTHAVGLMVSSDHTAVQRVLERIPRERLDEGPDLAVCAAGLLYFARQYADMEPHLVRARSQLRAIGADAPGTTVACLLLLTPVLRFRGDVDALRRTATRALEVLAGPGLSLPAAGDCRAVALGNLGTALLWSGRLEEAERTLTEGLAAEGTRLEVSRINMLSHLALVEAASGRLRESSEHATEAVELVEARGWAPLAQAATAYLALSLIHLRRNDVAGAERLQAQGEAAAVWEPPARWALMLAGARMDASLGRVASARTRLATLRRDLQGRQPPAFLASWFTLAVAEIDLAAGDPEPGTRLITQAKGPEPLTSPELVGAARALLARGQPQDADDVLAPLREPSVEYGVEHGIEDGVTVDAWLLTALAADRQREDNRATEALRRATELAEHEDVRRPFVELYPEHVARLLTLMRQRDPGAGGFADDLLAEIQPPQGDPAWTTVLAESLTDRELIVLKFLPTMMTNAEIASELFVSVNTVKAHLKRIFRKLEVPSRREAVHRAREVGLLSDTPV